MKYYSLHSLSFLLLCLLMAACSKEDDIVAPVAQKSIVILYDNDVHCAIDGYTKFAGLRDAIRQADTAYVAVVSSGDFLQGALAGAISTGEHIVGIMRNVGYDAVTLGNHEFDYGVPRMQELLPQLGVPVVCTNLFEYGGTEPLYPGYVIHRYGTKRIAFVGALTPETMRDESYSFFDTDGSQLYDLRTAECYSLVQDAVDKARGEGADYVVVLSHLGEAASETGVDSHGLVAATRGINAVLDGHTHSVIPADYVANLDGEMIPVTQTGTAFANYGKLWISTDGQFHTSLIADADNPYSNAVITTSTDSVKALMEEVAGRKIAVADFDLPAKDASGQWLVRKQEVPLGNLVADSYRTVMVTDIGLVNGGGMRNNLSAGDITYGDIINVQPNDNHLCCLEATGAEIVAMIEKCTAICPQLDGQFPQVSGMKFTIHTASHTVSDVQVLNKTTGQYEPIESEKVYSISTTDYCYNGGGMYGMLKGCKLVDLSTILCRDAVATMLEIDFQGIMPDRYRQTEGRITIIED